MKRKLFALALALATLALVAACGEQPPEIAGENVILDVNMERGVGVLGTVSIAELGNITYNFDYEGTVPPGTESFWRLGQWGTKFPYAEGGVQSREGERYFLKDETKEFIVNPKSGEYSLNCDTALEYPTPKRDGDAWLHLITIQNLADISRVGEMENIFMEFDFSIDYCENLMAPADFNTDLHTALFQWVFIVKNDNPDSPDYNQYYWLNFPFYDGRSLTHPGYDTFRESSFLDHGKEDKSNAFIYMADSSGYFPEGGVQLGTRCRTVFDVKPYIQTSLNIVQNLPQNQQSEYPMLQFTVPEDLRITQFYIGWEVPGTFTCGATVYRNRLWYNRV